MKLSQKRKIITKRLQCCTKNYFNETSLHGFRYITDPKSSKFKSYFWTCVCIISTSLCVILIRSQIMSYGSNRITTSISTTAFPVWEVPFPAVTICNFNLVYKQNFEPFQTLLEQDFTSEQINDFFSNLSSLILRNKMNKDLRWNEFVPITKALRKAGYNTEQLMSKLAQPCDRLTRSCSWNTKELDCGEVFRVTKSNRGFCCSFNYQGLTESDQLKSHEDMFVSGVGPSYGLEVYLNPEIDQYVSTFKPSTGVDVSIHETTDFPDISIYSTTIRPGHDVSLSIKPEITESEKNVEKVDIKTRGCAFENELQMDWSSIYSYSTCTNECKARIIMKQCKCVPFYYPMKGKVKFCTLPDMGCLVKNQIHFKGNQYTLNNNKNTKTSCRCYPQCNEISYSYQLDLHPLRTIETSSNDSVLRVYFGHVSCVKILRSVFFTWELILASIGGLIGLCLGGSILSIIEFFYHIFEAIFSRYPKSKSIKIEEKKYQPKLYLSDFGRSRNLEL